MAVCALPRQPVCLKEGGFDVFLYKAAQNFEIFSNIENKK
jgi:hypothetical protein